MQPLTLLLLDINMPIMTGFDIVPLIKKRFRDVNTKRSTLYHEGKLRKEPTLILRPTICYLSQYEQSVMKCYIQDEEKAECFIEKPLHPSDLKALLRLICIL